MFRSLSSVARLRSCSRYLSLAADQNGLGFKSTYDNEQTRKILTTVNKSTSVELKNYNISGMRIKKLMQQRENTGEFRAVEDLLELDGFGIKVLEKFCKSVLESNAVPASESEAKSPEEIQELLDEEEEHQSLNKKVSFVTPNLLESVRGSLQTVVSFHIDTNWLAWTKFSYDRMADEKGGEPLFIVEDMQCYELDNQGKRMQLSDYVELLVNFNDKIPAGDVYVIESLQPPVQNMQQGALHVNLSIQKRQLMAMLSVLMASRRSMNNVMEAKDATLQQHQQYIGSVFFLRHFLTSRFYRFLVGNERVSSEIVINKLFEYSHSPAYTGAQLDPTLSSVHIPVEYRYHWKTSESRVKQEYMGNALLTGLTFLKLCVHRCRKSLKDLNRKTNKN